MNNNYSYFKRKIIQKTLTWSSLYTAIIIMLFLFFKTTLTKSVYYGEELLYPFYKWADDNRYFTIFIALFIGYALITLVLFRQLMGYMDEIMMAVGEIYKDGNSIISLSSELKYVAESMNKIKLDLREKERLAKDDEKRKNDLIIYLAHDLKTPLTSVIGYLTILKDEKEIDENFKNKYLNICYEKSIRLEDLINEFFEITRYNLNHIEIDKSNINFSLMMEQIIYEFKPLLKGKNLIINTDIEPLLQIDIDTNKIERVIDNIIRNAINYSRDNGHIHVSVKRVNNVVVICVENEGVTIHSSKLKHIFDEFYRMDSSRNTKTGGAGLGLAIAKSIVLAHGGTIEAKSKEGTVKIQISIPI